MMLFGTGLTLAVLMDATVVRGVLCLPSCASPAAGTGGPRRRWRALHARIGLHEGAPPAVPPAALPPSGDPDEMTRAAERPPARRRRAQRGSGEQLRAEIVAATKGCWPTAPRPPMSRSVRWPTRSG